MALFQILFVATAAALDVQVTCGFAPNYFTMDGIPNKPLTVLAGDTIFFHYDVGCTSDPIQIQNFDGSTYSIGPLNSFPTTAATPGCLIYASMNHPAAMTGIITVLGGMPCGAIVTASATLYNRPLISPLPTITLPPLYGNLVASGSLSASLYTCPVLKCSPISCLAPAYQQTDILANGCLGCTYCFTPLPAVLPPVVCPVRTCPLTPQCTWPLVAKTDILADGCPGCAYCSIVQGNPCADLSCLPCCPPIVFSGQLCRSCVSFF